MEIEGKRIFSIFSLFIFFMCFIDASFVQEMRTICGFLSGNLLFDCLLIKGEDIVLEFWGLIWMVAFQKNIY